MPSETKEHGAEEIKSTPAQKIEAPKARSKPTAVLAALGLLLVEIILPATAAGALLLWAFGSYNIWQIGKTNALVIFAIVMVVISLLLAVVLDSATASFRASKKMRGVRLARDPRTRIIKLALGGLVFPLVVFFAANYVPLATHGTVMNYLIAAATPPVRLTPPDEVGAIAMDTDNPSTKLLSIQVLQGFQSPEALNQLIRMVNEDSGALADPGVSDALSKAVAAYGVTARDPLLANFMSIDPKSPGASTGVKTDLYDRYFLQSFDSLETEITNETTDPALRAAQLAQLQAAQAE
ncbi:MAG: hypothetical protein EHM21_06405, partial [Chloroflexi bacterium]